MQTVSEETFDCSVLCTGCPLWFYASDTCLCLTYTLYNQTDIIVDSETWDFTRTSRQRESKRPIPDFLGVPTGGSRPGSRTSAWLSTRRRGALLLSSTAPPQLAVLHRCASSRSPALLLCPTPTDTRLRSKLYQPVQLLAQPSATLPVHHADFLLPVRLFAHLTGMPALTLANKHVIGMQTCGAMLLASALA